MSLFGFGKDKSESPRPSGVDDAETPVSEKMIWICEKCGFKLAGEKDENDNTARRIQKNLKGLISENKRKREVRAMVTSCMNICPSRKMAAAVVDIKGPSVRFLEFDVNEDLEKTAANLYKLL